MRPQALRGLPVISVNSSARKWGLHDPFAIVVKEHAEEAVPNAEAFPGVPIVCAAGPYGNADRLVVAMSTIVSAMHFACYAGASVVLVAGLVCGTLEGRTHFKGYGHPDDV